MRMEPMKEDTHTDIEVSAHTPIYNPSGLPLNNAIHKSLETRKLVTLETCNL